MESKNDEIINRLRNNLKSIISMYEEQKEKNREFVTKIKELTHKITNLENKIKDNDSKFNNLKLAKSMASTDESSHDAKIKVNRIVREIDKCIALLNR
jgi:peptidoglycan hydrolase CwlO-like protein